MKHGQRQHRCPGGCGYTVKNCKCPTAPKAPITTIVVVDLAGYGFRVYWTVDGETWVNHLRKRATMNGSLKNTVVQRLLSDNPNAEVRQHTDFEGGLPTDLLTPNTRIL